MPPSELVTSRLRLRQWRDDDIDAFAAMSVDREVMRFFPSLMSRDQVETSVVRQQTFIADKGYGFWAVEEIGGAPFIGFCGIKDVLFDVPWLRAVEVGWRLARAYWGKGYATEAARGSVAHGFGPLGLAEIIAFVVPDNRRSIAVCERLGMVRDPSRDFEHPWVPQGAVSVGGFAPRHHWVYALRK